MKTLCFISFTNVEMAVYAAIFLVASLVVALVFGRFFIPYMRKKKLGQQILSEVTWHQSKAGTPTMGGMVFAVSTLVLCVAAMFVLKENRWLPLLLWAFSAAFGIVGFLDDFVKVAKRRNLGLTAIQKLLLQLAVSLAFVSLLRHMGLLTANLYIPIFGVTLHLQWVLYLTLAVLYISGYVNAVNFTDGVDGMLSIVTLPVLALLAAVAIDRLNWGALLFAAALFGGLLGFLVYNFNPAKVFMGDTGSMFIGGAVCALGFAVDRPLILVVVGLIYIAEILSVVMQVTYFKLTHGKRIFRMSPIHHHFEMGGWSEKKLCAVFGGISLVMCVVGWLVL